MDTDGLSIQSAVSQALDARQANVATQAQTAVLKKQIDAQAQSAAALLQMMGKGRNLDVVG